MKNLFKNADNSLTSYSFACGYVQIEEIDNLKVELFMEHHHYHLTLSDKNKRVGWLTFENNQLTKAKHLFNKISSCIN